MTSAKHFRELRDMAQDAGILEPRIETKGQSKHAKLVGKVGDRLVRIAIPGSPGDKRWLLNLKADWRRMVRQRGSDVS